MLGATRDTAPRGRRDTSSSPRARTSPCSSSAGRGQFNCVGCGVYSVLCTVYSVGSEKFQLVSYCGILATRIMRIVRID